MAAVMVVMVVIVTAVAPLGVGAVVVGKRELEISWGTTVCSRCTRRAAEMTICFICWVYRSKGVDKRA